MGQLGQLGQLEHADSGLVSALLSSFTSSFTGPQRAALGFWLLRLVGFLLSVPLFSSRLVPLRLRLGFACLVLLCLLLGSPQWHQLLARAAEAGGPLTAGGGSCLGAMLGELLLGLALGWCALVALSAVRAAAVLLSDQVGLSLGGIMDPLAGQDEPTLRSFHSALALFIFLSADLHHLFLRLGVESFVTLPAGMLSPGAAVPALVKLLLSMGGSLFQAVLLLAFPVTIALCLVSAAQGVLSSALPEMELFVLGLPLRFMAAFAVMFMVMPLTTQLVERLMEHALRGGEAVLRGAAP